MIVSARQSLIPTQTNDVNFDKVKTSLQQRVTQLIETIKNQPSISTKKLTNSLKKEFQTVLSTLEQMPSNHSVIEILSTLKNSSYAWSQSKGCKKMFTAIWEAKLQAYVDHFNGQSHLFFALSPQEISHIFSEAFNQRFALITKEEVINYGKFSGKENFIIKCPHFDAVLKIKENVYKMIISHVLAEKSEIKRQELITKLITIADTCFKQNNLAAAETFSIALENISIERAHIKNSIPKQILLIKNQLLKALIPSNNAQYAEMRKQIKELYEKDKEVAPTLMCFLAPLITKPENNQNLENTIEQLKKYLKELRSDEQHIKLLKGEYEAALRYVDILALNRPGRGKEEVLKPLKQKISQHEIKINDAKKTFNTFIIECGSAHALLRAKYKDNHKNILLIKKLINLTEDQLNGLLNRQQKNFTKTENQLNKKQKILDAVLNKQKANLIIKRGEIKKSEERMTEMNTELSYLKNDKDREIKKEKIELLEKNHKNLVDEKGKTENWLKRHEDVLKKSWESKNLELLKERMNVLNEAIKGSLQKRLIPLNQENQNLQEEFAKGRRLPLEQLAFNEFQVQKTENFIKLLENILIPENLLSYNVEKTKSNLRESIKNISEFMEYIEIKNKDTLSNQEDEIIKTYEKTLTLTQSFSVDYLERYRKSFVEIESAQQRMSANNNEMEHILETFMLMVEKAKNSSIQGNSTWVNTIVQWHEKEGIEWDDEFFYEQSTLLKNNQKK